MNKTKHKHRTPLTVPSNARWYVAQKCSGAPGLPDTRIVIDLATVLPRTVDVSEAGMDYWHEVTDPSRRVDVAVRQFERVFVDLQQWRKEPRGAIPGPHLHPANFRTDLPEWAVSAPLL